MITDRDIEKLKQVFATKEDLKDFATKKDLQSMEERFNRKFATKEDISKFPTKDEMRTEIHNQILPVQLELQVIKTKVMKVDVDLTKFKEELLSEMQNLRDDMHATTPGYGDRLEEHHQRLLVLENS
jgi:hypothetical protein